MDKELSDFVWSEIKRIFIVICVTLMMATIISVAVWYVTKDTMFLAAAIVFCILLASTGALGLGTYVQQKHMKRGTEDD